MLYTVIICTCVQTLLLNCCYSEHFCLLPAPGSCIFCFLFSKLVPPFIFHWSYLKYAIISRVLGAFCDEVKRRFFSSLESLALYPVSITDLFQGGSLSHLSLLCTHYQNLHEVHGGINTTGPFPPKRNEKLAKSCSRGRQQELFCCSFAELQVKKAEWRLHTAVCWTRCVHV